MLIKERIFSFLLLFFCIPQLGLIAEPSNGYNGKIGTACKTVSKAIDVNADCGRRRLTGRAPYVLHELQAGEGLVRVGEKLVEDAEFLLGQDLFPFGGFDCEGIVVQDSFADDKLMFGYNSGPAEKCPDMEKEKLFIHRLSHVVISAGNKTFFHIRGETSGGKHQDEQIIFAVTQKLAEA